MSTLHLLYSGRHTDASGQPVTLTPADLRAMAEAYDPALFAAPLVIGHPATNAPAFGHLARLVARPGQQCPAASPDCWDLEGEPADVHPALRDAARAGHYTGRSLSLFPPDHPSNPKPGVWYPRHVGFLGAAAPAIPGLRGADLAADEGAVLLLAAAPDPAAFDFPTPTETAMPDPTPAAAPAPATPAAPAPAVDFAARAAELDAREARLRELETRLREVEASARAARISEFAAGLTRKHHLAPAVEPRIVAVLAALPTDAPPVDFAAAAGEPARQAPLEQAVCDLLGALVDPANRIPFGEFAAAAVVDPEAARVERAARIMAGLPADVKEG